ncbi:Leucine-rich repeat-containing protein 69 [Chelonia mydas]|uniref:Leucine-rich repeat-containing protein 69 n=1 Tax=Chelonia mydas TaxID=8469 RepID=M7CC31_CHEMY|nr:Leucine-rich repeat-containing protein 69 [Chelonia mydas]
MEDLMLMELYCENNPLLQKQPVSAIQEEEVWSLKEIAARFIFSQLTKEDSILRTAVKQNLEACNILSKKQECAQCGQGFLNMWLECVRFVNVRQSIVYVPTKRIKSAEYVLNTMASIDIRSGALWVAIPQFPQSPLPIGILG